MKEYLPLIQLVVPIILIILILFQQRGTALGSAFGQDSGGSFYANRRGIQKNLLWLTILFGAIYIGVSLLNLYLSR